MVQSSFSVVAAQSGGAFSTGDVGLFVVVAVGILVLAAWLLSFPLTFRRRLARDAREIITALEDLRAGRAKARPETESGSPVALIYDASIGWAVTSASVRSPPRRATVACARCSER